MRQQLYEYGERQAPKAHKSQETPNKNREAHMFQGQVWQRNLEH